MIAVGLVVIFGSGADAMFGAAVHVPGLGILLGITAITGLGGFVMLGQGLKDAGEDFMAGCRASCRRL